jgi:hypothetical protein
MRETDIVWVGVGRRVMNKCVGIEGKFCGLEFDPGLEFPDDTLCDECFDEMAEEVAQ